MANGAAIPDISCCFGGVPIVCFEDFRRLTRVEWCKVRRLMGKPRRCSAAFFAEERAELARKRYKIRLLQQRKQGDITNFKDLPDNIPLQLTIGARVTAR